MGYIRQLLNDKHDAHHHHLVVFMAQVKAFLSPDIYLSGLIFSSDRGHGAGNQAQALIRPEN